MGNTENSMIVEDFSSIENLPDDCLRIIFQYLPIFDRVKIESVSKRWQRLSRESWYLFKSLDLSLTSWGVTNKTQIDNDILTKVLSRCSQYITVVNFAKKSYPPFKRISFPNFNSTTIIIICSSCPNMHSLNISDLAILWDNGHLSRMMRFMFLNACERRMVCDQEDQRECERTFCLCRLQNSGRLPLKSRQKEEHMILESLISRCQNLKEFGMRMFFYDETYLWIKLLKTMTNIKRLSLTEFPGTLYAYLSFDTIEELLLEGNDGMFPAHLSNVIRSFKKLKTLVMNTSRFINDAGMRNLLSQAETLENLGLIRDSNFLSIEGVNYIPRFTYLKKLNVCGNNLIDDHILEALAVNCEQLIFLNISNCKKVTDNGLLSISTLPELQFLIVSRSVTVSDKYLGNFHNLKVLDCQYCPLIRDEGLCILIERAPELRVLILEGCIRVTENVFDTAVDVAESGLRRIVLNINMSSHAEFDVKKFNNATPLLRIVKEVKYQDSCRMDFKNEYFPVNDDNYIFCDFSTDE